MHLLLKALKFHTSSKTKTKQNKRNQFDKKAPFKFFIRYGHNRVRGGYYRLTLCSKIYR